MSKRMSVGLFRLIVGFSLLFTAPALFVLSALPVPDAMACHGWGEQQQQQQIGFMLQAPIDKTSCPTITVLGILIDTTSAIFGGSGDSALHCDNLAQGQMVTVTFSSDAVESSSGQFPGALTATSVTLPWGDQSDVIVEGPIQSTSTTTPTTSLTIQVLGLPINLSSSTLLASNDDEPITLTTIANLTATEPAESQFVKVVGLADTTTSPESMNATSLFLNLLETQIVAPLDSTPASSCGSLSILGQTVDISSTTIFEGQVNGSPLTCSYLQAGQWVKLTLQNETVPLAATEVEIPNNARLDNQPMVTVTSPLMAIADSDLPYTVSVLGSSPVSSTSGAITVDISNAYLVNEDGQPIALSDLIAGQFVELTLTSNVPSTSSPQFTATEVESMTPGNVVDFYLFDRHGHQINDDTNDISATISFARPGKGARGSISLRATSNGQFSVANIPQGQAKVSVTRKNNGKTSKASTTVNVTRKGSHSVRITLNQ